MTAAVQAGESLPLRGLRLHARCFGPAGAPVLFLLHGWLDNSATWAPVIERLLERASGRLRVIAPDARGHGLSQWAPGGYWFPDYVADLDALVEHYAPDTPLWLAGHSMGSQVVSLYAGLRPERVQRLAVMDGLMLPDMPANDAPRRYRRWLDQLRSPPEQRGYTSFDALTERIRKQNARLSTEQAAFVARCWADQDEDGTIRLLADPAHRLNGPQRYHADDAEAVWQRITARTLILYAGESTLGNSLPEATRLRRHACFRGHHVVNLPKVGHMMHFEAPRATADALADFFLKSATSCN